MKMIDNVFRHLAVAAGENECIRVRSSGLSFSDNQERRKARYQKKTFTVISLPSGPFLLFFSHLAIEDLSNLLHYCYCRLPYHPAWKELVTVLNQNFCVLGENLSQPARENPFDTRDDDALSHAQHLHELVIYGAMDWSYNKPFSKISGEKSARQLRLSTRTEQREVRLWRSRHSDANDSVTGLVTTCTATINAPHHALNLALRCMFK